MIVLFLSIPAGPQKYNRAEEWNKEKLNQMVWNLRKGLGFGWRQRFGTLGTGQGILILSELVHSPIPSCFCFHFSNSIGTARYAHVAKVNTLSVCAQSRFNSSNGRAVFDIWCLSLFLSDLVVAACPVLLLWALLCIGKRGLSCEAKIVGAHDGSDVGSQFRLAGIRVSREALIQPSH